jgi:hypothetical protein
MLVFFVPNFVVITQSTRVSAVSNSTSTSTIASSKQQPNEGRLPVWLPYAISACALGISILSLYFQSIHTRGARVTLLNDGDDQDSSVRWWQELPQNVQNDFHDFEQKYPGYALVRLVVLNTGDRPGYLKIESAIVPDAPWKPTTPAETPVVSYYTYVLVPALAVTDKLILLRNLPEITAEVAVGIRLKIVTGGPAGRFRPHLKTRPYDCGLEIRLIPTKMPHLVDSPPTSSRAV